MGIGEVHRTDGLFHLLTRLLCETSHFGAEIGKNILFQIFGYSETYEEVLLVKTKDFLLKDSY